MHPRRLKQNETGFIPAAVANSIFRLSGLVRAPMRRIANVSGTNSTVIAKSFMVRPLGEESLRGVV